jgi:hypothetical protein
VAFKLLYVMDMKRANLVLLAVLGLVFTACNSVGSASSPVILPGAAPSCGPSSASGEACGCMTLNPIIYFSGSASISANSILADGASRGVLNITAVSPYPSPTSDGAANPAPSPSPIFQTTYSNTLNAAALDDSFTMNAQMGSIALTNVQGVVELTPAKWQTATEALQQQYPFGFTGDSNVINYPYGVAAPSYAPGQVPSNICISSMTLNVDYATSPVTNEQFPIQSGEIVIYLSTGDTIILQD